MLASFQASPSFQNAQVTKSYSCSGKHVSSYLTAVLIFMAVVGNYQLARQLSNGDHMVDCMSPSTLLILPYKVVQSDNQNWNLL